jgi:hypothetical protein
MPQSVGWKEQSAKVQMLDTYGALLVIESPRPAKMLVGVVDNDRQGLDRSESIASGCIQAVWYPNEDRPAFPLPRGLKGYEKAFMQLIDIRTGDHRADRVDARCPRDSRRRRSVWRSVRCRKLKRSVCTMPVVVLGVDGRPAQGVLVRK